MHLTRPKSSKGRSRSAVNNSACSGVNRSAVSPQPEPDRDLSPHSQSPHSQPGTWRQLSQDGLLQVLQQEPAAPPQSLNKYMVLPSIGGRQSEGSPGTSLDINMSKLSLSSDANLQKKLRRHEEQLLPTVTHISSSEADKRAAIRPKPPDPGPARTKEAGSLLLAIRAPCGRRFQQHFDPTDTLLRVRASAELRYEAEYGEVCIETMDVPRRTFTDMEMTLAQCGIPNRSVLCISLNDGEEHL